MRRGEHRILKRALQREDLRGGRAWALEERFRTFCEYRYSGAARTFFTRWCWRATHSRLTPPAAVAKLIQRHLPSLLTHLRHHRANAGLGGGATPSSTHTKALRAMFSTFPGCA